MRETEQSNCIEIIDSYDFCTKNTQKLHRPAERKIYIAFHDWRFHIVSVFIPLVLLSKRRIIK